MQADAFNGYNDPCKANRQPAPLLEAACWSHGRRKFFDLVKAGEAPIAAEAVRRIDELFAIERTINGKTPEQRLTVRLESFFHALKHAHPFMTNLTKARRVASIAPCAALNLESASN